LTAPRRVVITGISGHWATELARRLERDPSIELVVGIDTQPPSAHLERTEFIEADIRSPSLARQLPATGADTVVHCGIVWYPAPGKPARSLHDINVIGTLQLLAACERTETLERLVVRGSAAIYGCEGPAPYFFSEDMARSLPLRTRFQRDIGELENYFENFARRRPNVACCMLRFQPEIGPDLSTPLVRYFLLPVVPVQMGFDPRLQLVHEEDAHEALAAAVRNPVGGPVNVGPPGSISLSRLIRLLRRPTVPVPQPFVGPLFAQVGRRLGSGDVYTDGLRLLRFGRGVDIRRLREEVGYSPRFDAAGAARDFAAKARGRAVVTIPDPGTLLARLAG
jgi:UDP-glucose 4-epimerase